MPQNTVYANGNVEVLVPFGQKIAIGTFGGGVATISYLTAPGNAPQAWYIVDRISNDEVVYGTFTRDQEVRIEAGFSNVFYNIATDPTINIGGDAETVGGYGPDEIAILAENETITGDYNFTGGLTQNGNAVYTTADGPLGITNRSKIINGGFDIWQRNTTQNTDGYGSDDRWNNGHSESTKTHSQKTFALGQTDVPGNPMFYSETDFSTASTASSYVIKKQSIEGVRKFSGQVVTLSFYGKATSALNIVTEFIQFFGSGGSPSPEINSIGVTTHSLTTSWQRFTMNTTLPSISGKTLGTTNDALILQFWYEGGSNWDSRTNNLGNQSGIVHIANVQVEPGSSVSDFEYLPEPTIIQQCQRYYEKSYNLNINPGTVTTTGAQAYIAPAAKAPVCESQGFRTEKYKTPTVVFYSDVTGAANNVRDTDANADLAVSSTYGAGSGSPGYPVLTGTMTDGNIITWHWTAEAEL